MLILHMPERGAGHAAGEVWGGEQRVGGTKSRYGNPKTGGFMDSYGGCMVVLWWCYGGVMMVLWLCYGGFLMV